MAFLAPCHTGRADYAVDRNPAPSPRVCRPAERGRASAADSRISCRRRSACLYEIILLLLSFVLQFACCHIRLVSRTNFPVASLLVPVERKKSLCIIIALVTFFDLQKGKERMSGQSSTYSIPRIALAATATVLAGVGAYAVYFDYKRRNDPAFRKAIRAFLVELA